MAKRILVPLDRKDDAEFIVPIIRDTARGAGATVRLLHVAPTPRAVYVDGRVALWAEEEGSRLKNEALNYLGVIEHALQGVPVETVVRFGDPAEEILNEADDFSADLIAVTAGSSRLLKRMGRVAERLLKRATPPVMIVRR